MLCSKTSLSRSSARRLVIKATKRRCILTNAEKDTTWSIISQRGSYNTIQHSLNQTLFEWIIRHPHVISSPIPRDTVLVKVRQGDGSIVKERVGKLLLEISVRELHQDLIKAPPIGLSEVHCPSTNNIIVSERYLRNILPPQLRPITFSQKQLCACECCTIMKMIHSSLIKFRKKVIQSYIPQPKIRTRSSNNDLHSFDEYTATLKANDHLLSNDPRDMFGTMSCNNASGDGLMKWKCAMGRCNSCPQTQFPTIETFDDSPLDNIIYASYKYHLKCKLHGILPPSSSSCSQCLEAIAKKQLNCPEKLTRRKEITLLESSINHFHKDAYLPMLKRYRYHIALVTILSKHFCKKMRFDAFCKNSNWMFSERDYAERLVKQLDGEIQSDHFGDNPTLSIEGCTLQYHKYLPSSTNTTKEHESFIAFDFHSHFADFSRQDAATTFEHMCSMFKVHESIHGTITKNSVLLDHTDGCAKQYRSGNALFLLNIFSLKYHIVIDRAVGAPGHGKSIIDGLNAVDKHYLRKVMCMSGSTKSDDLEIRMKMYAITQNSTLSFAEECARLCGLESRRFGVQSSPTYDSRKQKVNERVYHVQDPDNVRYSHISKGTKGWRRDKSTRGNGIQYHYNFRADPALGLGHVAARRIPCMCEACINQLQKSWLPNKDFSEQPRYKPNNTDCQLWNVLGSLNNWRKISITDTDADSGACTQITTKNIFRDTLRDRASALMSLIEEGNYGAIATTDTSALSGYYVFCFRSCGYILQKGIVTNSGKIPSGELVCDITWLNPVPKSSKLYSHGFKDDSSLDTVVRIQHVVEVNVQFKLVTARGMLPKVLRPMFSTLKSKNTIIIDDDCHNDIIDTILARSHMDYDEYFSSTDYDYVSEDNSSDDEY